MINLSELIVRGRAHRLTPVSPEQARETVRRQISGEPVHYEHLDWIRMLAPESIEQLEREAIAALELLAEQMDMAWRGAGWGYTRADVRAICHARDDIEGARVLLAAAGVDLTPELEVLDCDGERLLAPWLPLADERLLAAAAATPEGWWVGPICPRCGGPVEGRGVSMGHRWAWCPACHVEIGRDLSR